MKKLLPNMKKITAGLLAALFLSLPITNIACAAEFSAITATNNQKSISSDYQYYGHDWDDDDDDYRYWCHRHKRYHKRGHKCHYYDHDRDHYKDRNGNAITGFIIGAVVGAVVAKNT